MGKKVNTYVGNVYESKRHPGTFVMVIDEDLDRKTVGVRNSADGKETALNLSTLQRWWKKVDDNTSVIPDPTPAPVDPIPAPQVDKQDNTPKKQTKGKGKKQVKTDKPNPLDGELVQYIINRAEELGATTYIPKPKASGKEYKFRVFKYQGKGCAYLNYGKKKCTLRCREVATKLTPTQATTPDKLMYNYGFDLFTLDDNTKVLIDTILNDAIKDQKQRNAHKTKKGGN